MTNSELKRHEKEKRNPNSNEGVEGNKTMRHAARRAHATTTSRAAGGSHNHNESFKGNQTTWCTAGRDGTTTSGPKKRESTHNDVNTRSMQITGSQTTWRCATTRARSRTSNGHKHREGAPQNKVELHEGWSDKTQNGITKRRGTMGDDNNNQQGDQNKQEGCTTLCTDARLRDGRTRKPSACWTKQRRT